jgi:hypothetical protein
MKIKNIIATTLLGLASMAGLSSVFVSQSFASQVKAENEEATSRIFLGVDEYHQMSDPQNYLCAEGVKAVIWGFNGEYSETEANGTLYDVTIISSCFAVSYVNPNYNNFRVFRTPNSTEAGVHSLEGITKYNLNNTVMKRPTEANAITVRDWNYADFCYGLNDNYIQFIPQGTTFTLDYEDCDINWLDAYATHYFATYFQFSDKFAYESTFTKMEKVEGQNKLSGTTTKDLYCTGVIFTRNNPDGQQYSWDSKWNQSTNQMGVTESGNFKLFDGKIGDAYNCASVDDLDSAETFAQDFLNTMTCDGQNRTFTNNDWTDFFDINFRNKPVSFKQLLKQSEGALESTCLRKVMIYRYDYILFFRGYPIYDWLERAKSPNISFAISNPITNSLDATSDSNTTTIIVVAIVATLSFVALVAVKKKKYR